MIPPNMGLWWSPRLIVAEATLPTQTRTAGIVFIDAASGTRRNALWRCHFGGRRAASSRRLAMNALWPPPTFGMTETAPAP